MKDPADRWMRRGDAMTRMSKMFDTEDAPRHSSPSGIAASGGHVTIEERGLWVEVVSVTVLIAGLGVWLAVQLAHTVPADIRWSSGVSLALLASGLVRVFGRRWVRERASPGDDFTDERDRELVRRADALTLNVFAVLAGVPLVLGLFGAERFWLTVALGVAFLLTGLANALIRLALYHRG
jgi:hypothetical protein